MLVVDAIKVELKLDVKVLDCIVEGVVNNVVVLADAINKRNYLLNKNINLFKL